MAPRAPSAAALCALALLLGCGVQFAVTAQSAFDAELACAAPQRLDTSALVCASCPANTAPDYRAAARAARPLASPSPVSRAIAPGASLAVSGVAQCVCAPGFVARVSATSGLAACEACPAGSAASADRTTCISCDSTPAAPDAAAFDAASALCRCPAGAALVERDAAGDFLPYVRCVACGPRAIALATDPTRCTPCPDPQHVHDPALGACVCNGSAWTATPDGARCLPTSVYAPIADRFPTSGAQTVTYFDIEDGAGNKQPQQSVQSYALAQRFAAAAVDCQLGAEPTACDALANLCVLQLYNDQAAACELFRDIAKSRASGVNGFDEWPAGMPLLQFASPLSILQSSAIRSRFTFSLDEERARGYVYNLKFVLVAYALNGTLLSAAPLGTQLHLCKGDEAQQLRFLRFGTNTFQSCVLPLKPLLLAQAEPVLYDLYLLDGERLYPVPVRIANVRANGVPVNRGADLQAVLVRRFFLVDTLSGRTAAGALPEVVRVAQHVKLRVSMQRGRAGYIYPPVLEISYAERRGTAANADAPQEQLGRASEGRPRASFQSEYTMDLDGFWRTVLWLFIVCLVLVVIIWFVRLYAWMQRNRSDGGGEFLLPAAAYLLGVVGWLFALLVYGVVLYWFVFFKWQADPFVLLPTSAAYARLYGILGTAFACHFLAVVYAIYRQSSCDLFFIDWERSRGLSLPPEGDVRRAKALSVSIWRTLLIANEFNELQTLRRVSLVGTLFALLVLLRGFNLDNLATAQPAFTDITPGQRDVVLSIAVVATLWLLLVLVQLVFQWAIGYRFFSNPITDFVDLLSLSNVSVLLLRERYCGFYLHGRSPHQHADVSLAEMTANLAQEAVGMTPRRGLGGAAAKPGVVSFELFVAREFRAAYDALLADVLQSASLFGPGKRAHAPLSPTAHMASPQPQAAGAPSAEQRLGIASAVHPGADAAAAAATPAVLAYHAANRMLTAFIDQSAATATGAQLSYTVERQSALRALLGLPPDMVPGRSVLVEAPATAFAATMFYGNEGALVLLNILVHVMADIAFNNTYASLAIVWLIECAFISLRRTLGKRNVAKKSLVDGRFLV